MNLIYRHFLCLPLVFFWLAGLHTQSVVLNEMVTSNSQYTDEDGDTPDWLELRNLSASAVNLSGWTLSDDPAQPARWSLPDFTLPGGEYLKIWASDKDRDEVGTARTLIRPEDDFRYLTPNSVVIPAWRTLAFNDNSWPVSNAGFGYGDGDDATVLPAGTRSVFIRKTFVLDDPALVTRLLLHIDYDDGFVAYLNGTEIARANLSGAFPAYNTQAITDREALVYQGGAPERFLVANPADVLQAGENLLSIQVHNVGVGSSDMSLLPWLTAVFSTTDVMVGTPPPPLLNVADSCPHTNFKLSAGETLYLFDELTNLADSLVSGNLPPDVSVGRLPQSPEETRLFEVTTPGAVNPDQGWLGAMTASVIFSVSGGPLNAPTTLTLSGAEAPAVIRFTIDATPPTASSEVYTSPIFIDDNTVVRAAIFRDGYLPSPAQTESYLLAAEHELPVVALVSDPDHFFDNDTGIYVLGDSYTPAYPFFGANFWEDWERPIHFAFYEPDGTLGTAFDAGVKIFGGWSRANDQRSLSIFARGQYGTPEIDYPLFPQLPFQEFQAVVLRNSGSDFLRSHFRDATITGLMHDADLETQAYRPCATYLNGEYWGIYNLREKVNEHFLAVRHGLNPNEIDLLEANAVTIHGSNEDYLALLDFVQNNSLTNDLNFAEVEAQMEIDNFILYYATQIYFDNTDWPGNNVKYWRPQEGKWRWILFDTDFGIGGWSGNNYQNNTLDFALESNGPGWPNPPWSTFLFRNLMENTGFRHRFINRFADEMNTRFLPNRVREHIDSLRINIAPEISRHFERWDGDLAIWNQNVTWMRAFAQQRPPHMKQHIVNQFDLPNYHQLQLTNQTPERGHIRLNSLTIEDASWAGDYFENVPVSLEAVPKPGYAFSHWMGANTSELTQISLNVNQPAQLEAVFVPSDDAYIVINEINYNSGDERPTGDWIELHNPTSTSTNLENWSVRDEENDPDHHYVIPAGTVLPAYGYLVIARDLDDFTTYYPELDNVIGELAFGLSSNGDAVRLFDPAGNLHDLVEYSPNAPWPTAANGQGPTLELLSPTLDNSLPQSWANVHDYGSPGVPNTDESAVTEVSPIQDFTVFPNPSAGALSLVFRTEQIGNVNIRLYNTAGRLARLLFSGSLRAGTHQQEYALERLAPGTYLLEVCIPGSGCVQRKWVKI